MARAVAARLIFLDVGHAVYTHVRPRSNGLSGPLTGVILAGDVLLRTHIQKPLWVRALGDGGCASRSSCYGPDGCLWRAADTHKGHGARLLAGAFFMSGLHGIDQPLWPRDVLFLLRVAFDHLLYAAIGVSMVVLVLERARARSEELNDKMRQLTLLTAASTQTLSVQEMLEQVLVHLVESMGATHGLVRLVEGEGR